MFIQLLINGLIAGSIYAIIAVGFSIIFSTNRFVHFAHGSVIVTAGFILHSFYSLLGINFYIASFLTVISAAVLGLLVYLLIYYPLRRRKTSAVILLIASLGLMVLLDNLNLLAFGADVKVLNFIPVRGGIDFLGAVITPLQIFIIFSSVILLLAVLLFVKFIKLGRIMRAVADNHQLAAIMGINVHKIEAMSFVIGSIMAGFAAILLTLEYGVAFNMGTSLTISGYTGAIIGGVSSLIGSILGAFLLGLIENFGIWFLPSGYKMAIAFVLLLIFLLIRPKGIFGIKDDR